VADSVVEDLAAAAVVASAAVAEVSEAVVPPGAGDQHARANDSTFD
jgi:hypothetical protein